MVVISISQFAMFNDSFVPLVLSEIVLPNAQSDRCICMMHNQDSDVSFIY